MTVTESKSGDRLLLWAVAISLTAHLLAYGGWKWSQAHPWWKHLQLPAWMEMGREKFVTSIAKKLPAPVKPQEVPMLYIDVDPNMATVEPPQTPKYYSSANTEAANPEIKVRSDVPDISGTEKQVMKTVPPAPKPVPLQPSPPKPPTPEVAESKPPPRQTYTPGDVAMAKPAEKSDDSKGTNAPEQGKSAEAQPQHERPRTLAEAREQQGIPGNISHQVGGVSRLSPDSSMSAMRTPYGDYDRDFINAVRSRWDELLENRVANSPGKVVVEFDLHSDGRITGMKNTVNEVNSLLETLCEEAILDPAPYRPWTQEMRSLIIDPRHLTFTFIYENE